MTPTVYLGFLIRARCRPRYGSAILRRRRRQRGGGDLQRLGVSILGVFLSPLLVGALMHTQGGNTDVLHAIGSIIRN